MRQFNVRDFCEIQHELTQQMTAFQDRPWHEFLQTDEIITQIRVEMAEALKETDAAYKWWKPSKGTFDAFDIKMEIIDAWHFYLIKYLKRHFMAGGKLRDISPNEIGHTYYDQSIFENDMSMYDDNGVINHHQYNALCNSLEDHYEIDRTLALSVLFGGMTPEEFSAIYAAKSTLNGIRTSAGMKTGLYSNKPSNGVEDSKRVKYIIDTFNDDPSFTLDDVTKTVTEEFFDVHGQEQTA